MLIHYLWTTVETHEKNYLHDEEFHVNIYNVFLLFNHAPRAENITAQKGNSHLQQRQKKS